MVLNNLGYFFLDLGDVEAARDRLEEALTLRRAVGDRPGEIVTLRNLARVDKILGRHRDALVEVGLALTLARATDNRRSEALARMLEGETELARGQPEAARIAFDAALSLQRAIGNQRLIAEALLQLGEVGLRMGDSTAARWREAAELFRSLSEPAGEVLALYGGARAALRRGREDQARGQLETALARIEGQRPQIADATQRTTFLAARRGIYELHVLLLLRRHRADPEAGFAAAALEASERARARVLFEVVTGAMGRGGTAVAPPPTATATAIQAALEPRTVLLEILLGEARGVLWLVRRDGIEAFDLPPRREIESLARRAHEDLSAIDLRTGATAKQALAALGRLLLAPVAERLEGAQRIVAVADGALHLVPFAALPDPGVPGAPLVLHHEIVQLPSASVLLAQRRAPQSGARRTLAMFADPIFGPADPRLSAAGQIVAPAADGGQAELISATRAAADLGLELARLPHTRREAEAIAALVPAEKRLTAFGFEANRGHILEGALAGYRIVHFATHSLVNPRRPELSGLVLSQLDASGRRRDGFLRLADIAVLDLDAELVVLSGCRTALGREVRGAGLLGLVRGFMIAGVPRVVASLWPVEDQATARLMTHFYRALLEGGQTPASALRTAQLALRGDRRWADPYFWGAFVLQGDWR